jgi:hypothetical protein
MLPRLDIDLGNRCSHANFIRDAFHALEVTHGDLRYVQAEVRIARRQLIQPKVRGLLDCRSQTSSSEDAQQTRCLVRDLRLSR